jgi:Raf kinase inhibitor-like YbhB/YbcL family protein
MKLLLQASAAALLMFSTAQAGETLTIKAEGIDAEGYITPEHAFCAPSETGHAKDGNNKSIGLSWSKGPEGTKSYAIIGVDVDVPTVFDDAGKEGKILPADMPRQDFYHWVLVNIPATVTEIKEGADSSEHGKNGKSEMQMPYGLRGINDYAGYMANDPERKGVYAGYDGPCPPWNDERIHNYHFKVFALDVDTLPLTGNFSGKSAMETISNHTLATGEVVGKYTLNTYVKK